MDEGAKAVIAQGLAYDLERNTGGLTEIRRGILTSTGNRYSQDMINVTSNAACSIATRNAIFDVIPQVLWWDAYEQMKEKALAAAAIPEKLQNAVAFFVQKGAKEEEIFTAMGVKSIADMTRDHLEIFIGLRTALKAGAMPIDRMFHPDAADERAKLTLVADEDQFNPIDRQLQGGGKPGGDPKAAAGEAPGGSPQGGRGGKKTSPAKGKVDSAAKDKPIEAATTVAPAAVDDAVLLDKVEHAEKAAQRADKGKAIKEAKGALRMISETSEDPALKARADALLNKYELED
jgi:hypothetical protein